MRGGPLAGEALGFIESVRSQVAFTSEEIPDGELPQPTRPGLERKGSKDRRDCRSLRDQQAHNAALLESPGVADRFVRISVDKF